MKINQYITSLYGLLIILMCVSFTSCKQENAISPKEDKNITKMVFSVIGAKNTENSFDKYGTIQPVVKGENERKGIELSKKLHLSYSSEITSIESGLDPNLGIRKLASTTPIKDGIKYRILIYNKDTDVFVSSVDATVGTTTSVDVPSGVNYKWFAYSYNTNEPIPAPVDMNEPDSPITIDKDFLWASSGTTAVKAEGETIPLIITFDHKIAEVVLELNFQGLYGDINTITTSFDDDYFYGGTFNIKTGIISPAATATTLSSLSKADFETPSPTSQPSLRKKYYTTNVSKLGNVKVSITSLNVTFINGITSQLLSGTDSPKEIPFNFPNATLAKSHRALGLLQYTIPTKSILHATSDNSYYAYAAQPPIGSNVARAAYSMIKTTKNYGTDVSSIVRTAGFTHDRVFTNNNPTGGLATKLTAASKPDIVIIAYGYALSTADEIALKTYIDNKGVVIMMTDYNERTQVQSFLQSLIDPSITLVASGYYAGGTLFELDYEKKINDIILNGPFGNIRGSFWGSDDGTYVLQATNLPIGDNTNQVTLYSDKIALNADQRGALGANMFKHNSKNFFWIGDGTFLSANYALNKGWNTAYYAQFPFTVVDASITEFKNPIEAFNYDYFPIRRPKYGVNYAPFAAGTSYDSYADNAVLFANLMAWALGQSEFMGINSAP